MDTRPLPVGGTATAVEAGVAAAAADGTLLRLVAAAAVAGGVAANALDCDWCTARARSDGVRLILSAAGARGFGSAVKNELSELDIIDDQSPFSLPVGDEAAADGVNAITIVRLPNTERR